MQTNSAWQISQRPFSFLAEQLLLTKILSKQGLIGTFHEEKMGGRIMSASTGGAPNAPEVMSWIKEVLGFPITNNYGSTEGGLMTLNGQIQHR